MHWQLLPALAAPGVMTLFRLGALMRRASLAMVGLTEASPVGASERSLIGAAALLSGYWLA